MAYANKLDRRMMPFTCERAFKDVSNTIGTIFLDRDEGEKLVKIDLPLPDAVFSPKTVINMKDNHMVINHASPSASPPETPLVTVRDNIANAENKSPILFKFCGEWSSEEEPRPAVIDALANSCVRIKNKVSLVDSYDTFTTTGGTDTASVGGFSKGSRGSKASKGSKAPSRGLQSRSSNKTKGSNSTGNKGDKLEEEDGGQPKRPLIIERPITPDSNGNNKKIAVKLTPEEAKRMAIIADMEAKEKEYMARLAMIRQKDQEEDEKFMSEVAELKGKEYTLDRSGKAIPVNMLKADKLPVPISLDATIADMADNTENMSKSKGRKGSNLVGRAQTAGPTVGGGGRKASVIGSKKGEEDAFFQVSNYQQPSLLATMTLTAGVNLKEGDGVKAGPKRPDDPKHMSRKQFTSHQTLMDTAVPLTAPTGGKLVTGSAPGSAGSINGAKDLSIELPETGSPRETEGGNLTRPRGSPEGRVEEEGGKKDLNLILVSAPDWGVNPSSTKYEPSYSPPRKVS